MTEVLLRKEIGNLSPDSDDATRIVGKIGRGSRVVADIKDTSRRSGQQHRYWFILANILFENQEYFEDFETFRKCLLVKLGFCDVFKFKDGTVVPIAHSLKFAKMTPDEFGRLVDATLKFAEEMGFDRSALETEAREHAA